MALQKALGNKAQVGNKQINCGYESLGPELENELIDLMSKLIAFREKFNTISSSKE